MGLTGSTTLLRDQYAELYSDGKDQGFVVTRRGYGTAVLRQNVFSGDDIIVQYVYPKRYFEAIMPAYVKKTNFLVRHVKCTTSGRYVVYLTINNETLEFSLSDTIFNGKPFIDKTHRQIIIDSYERCREGGLLKALNGHDIEPPPRSLALSDLSPRKDTEDSVSERSKASNEIKQINSDYEIDYEYQEVYESE